jgi:hypothetical protein
VDAQNLQLETLDVKQQLATARAELSNLVMAKDNAEDTAAPYKIDEITVSHLTISTLLSYKAAISELQSVYDDEIAKRQMDLADQDVSDKMAWKLENCPVCLDSDNCPDLALNCGHRVCRGCYGNMHSHSLYKCPQCNTQITTITPLHGVSH